MGMTDGKELEHLFMDCREMAEKLGFTQAPQFDFDALKDEWEVEFAGDAGAGISCYGSSINGALYQMRGVLFSMVEAKLKEMELLEVHMRRKM